MNDPFWLSDAQMARIEPSFPLSHGIARVNDRIVEKPVPRSLCSILAVHATDKFKGG